MNIAKWSDTSPSEIQGIQCVAFDIDDTFSTHGKITKEAFRALWNLRESGFKTVAITGRPAGWCDHIARFWPVDAVVGENGAFTLTMKGQKLERILTTDLTPEAAKEGLARLREGLLKKFPRIQFASDQPYREFDLAIDINEDVKKWHDKDIRYLVSLCREMGAVVKESSVHVNTWYGDYDKKAGFIRMREALEFPDLQHWIYLGDSPNDEPMFAYFKHSVGVANLIPYLDRVVSKINHPPTWVTNSESGAGFCEVAEKLIAHAKISRQN